MTVINKLSSADLWNLNYTQNQVKNLVKMKKYAEAVKESKVGLLMATRIGDINWVRKFDEILAKTVRIYKKSEEKKEISIDNFL
ncbi:MAG: hypothetical protein ACFFAO_08955 [Candidatus Hermodarchaeota archaeon]